MSRGGREPQATGRAVARRLSDPPRTRGAARRARSGRRVPPRPASAPRRAAQPQLNVQSAESARYGDTRLAGSDGCCRATGSWPWRWSSASGRARERSAFATDPGAHGAVLGALRLRRGGSRCQPAPSRRGHVVRRACAGGRRAPVWPTRRTLRAGGSRSWRARGHARRRRARRPDPATGAGRQGAGVGAVHRLGRLGWPGGADRADRLCAGVGRRSARATAAAAPALAGGVRRGRLHCGDVQRADRRCLLCAGGDPRRFRDPVLRRRRAELGDRVGARARGVRLGQLPSPAVLHARLAVRVGPLRRARRACRGDRRAVHPRAVRDRGPRRPAVARAGLGAAGRLARSPITPERIRDACPWRQIRR